MLTLGRYTLNGEIAAGGMASVHLARLAGAAGFARIVAAKRLHPHIARDREVALAFAAEARLVSRIRHPNVVPTLDVVDAGDELVIIMEYVHGESFARLSTLAVEQGLELPVPVVIAILVDTLHGLHAAHEARDESGQSLGIVHRDVSPQNVLVGIDGIARVLDFGIAKAAGRLFTTREGVTKGKLAYMAPEQAYGEAVSPATDVFAASVVLWELLCGRRLFAGHADADTIHNVLYKIAEPPSRYRKDVSAAVDAVVLRGLSRNAEERFPSARAMADALEAATTPARPSEVGHWVARLAAEPLDARARCIAALEAGTASHGHLAVAETVAADALRITPELDGDNLPSGGASQRLLVASSTASLAEPTADHPTVVVRSLSPRSTATLPSAGVMRRSRRLGPTALVAAATLTLVGGVGVRGVSLSRPAAMASGGEATPAWEPSPARMPRPTPPVEGPHGASHAPASAPSERDAVLSRVDVRAGAAEVGSRAKDEARRPAVPGKASPQEPPTSRPRPAPEGGAGCAPPYVVTSKGHVVFKDECF